MRSVEIVSNKGKQVAKIFKPDKHELTTKDIRKRFEVLEERVRKLEEEMNKKGRK